MGPRQKQLRRRVTLTGSRAAPVPGPHPCPPWPPLGRDRGGGLLGPASAAGGPAPSPGGGGGGG
eukprot:6646187-Pyramimonas_sp.AAC.1